MRKGYDNLADCVRISMIAGEACRDGRITEEENRQIVTDLMPLGFRPSERPLVPEWMREEFEDCKKKASK